MKIRVSRLWLWIAGALVVLGCLAAIVVTRLVDVSKLPHELGSRTPGELIRYTKLRLQGHNKLEAVFLGPIHFIQARVERPVPQVKFPTLGKGQQRSALPRVQYTPTGRPKEASSVPASPTLESTPGDIPVATAEGLINAVNTAKAGQTIHIAPGRYALNTRLNTNSAGTKDQPITVRAAQPGQVTLEFSTEVGFRVSKPFWVFENLHIRGVCKEHGNCEHAFHIFGQAQSTVVRNNLIEDFNAHLKINGTNADWPDDGLVQYNTLTNTSRRETHLPVTPIDIVGANHWKIADNIISNFVKGDGNKISYGMFMKGAGRGGRIERNLIICTPQDISQPGARVGISFGGGGTGKPYCRDQRCDAEHTAGLAANNIVAHCNDFGIDVNQSNGIVIAHNTLINTAGIDVRRAPASAKIYGNLLDGRIRQRDGGQMKLDMNEVVSMTDIFENPDELKLDWRKPPENIPSLAVVPTDFYGQTRSDGTSPGALTSKGF